MFPRCGACKTARKIFAPPLSRPLAFVLEFRLELLSTAAVAVWVIPRLLLSKLLESLEVVLGRVPCSWSDDALILLGSEGEVCWEAIDVSFKTVDSEALILPMLSPQLTAPS